MVRRELGRVRSAGRGWFGCGACEAAPPEPAEDVVVVVVVPEDEGG